MARINDKGYLERRSPGSGKLTRQNNTWRDWWLVKYSDNNQGKIELHNITISAKYVGKRVRFKIEVVEEK